MCIHSSAGHNAYGQVCSNVTGIHRHENRWFTLGEPAIWDDRESARGSGGQSKAIFEWASTCFVKT